jgi:carboxyl-terminal processing protease
LIQDDIIFDYATRFAGSHASIAPPDQFEISDEIYSDFHQFLLSKKFTYESRSEVALRGLIETARKERAYEDTKAEFEALEKKLTIDVDVDLQKFRKEVSSVLADEIVTRYYYQKGAVIASIKDDTDISRAKSLLANGAEYRSLLQPVTMAGQIKK